MGRVRWRIWRIIDIVAAVLLFLLPVRNATICAPSCTKNTKKTLEERCKWNRCEQCEICMPPLPAVNVSTYRCTRKQSSDTLRIAYLSGQPESALHIRMFTEYVLKTVQDRDCFASGNEIYDIEFRVYDTSRVNTYGALQAEQAAQDRADILLTSEFSRTWVLEAMKVIESHSLPSVHTGVSSPRFPSRWDYSHNYFIQHSYLDLFLAPLRAAYVRGYRTVAIVRKSSYINRYGVTDSDLGGLHADVGIASLRLAYELGYTVVGPTLAWCQKYSNTSVTCRIENGACKCGLQSEVDNLNLGRFGTYRSLDEVPATFYEFDVREKFTGFTGWAFNTVAAEREAYFEAILEDIRSQTGGEGIDVLLLPYNRPWDLVSAAISMKPAFAPKMLCVNVRHDFSIKAFRQNATSLEWDVLALSEEYGYWITKATQWHPGIISSDPIFGSTSNAVKLVKESFGMVMDVEVAALLSAGSMLYLVVKNLPRNLVNLTLEQRRKEIEVGLAHFWDDTMYGAVRFNQDNMNFGKEPVSYQTSPVHGDEVVLPEVAASAILYVPLPSWDSRTGCPLGHRNTGIQCEACIPGEYSDVISAGMTPTYCKECPTGTGTGLHDFGTIVCSKCPAGRIQIRGLHLGICTNCANGSQRSDDLPGDKCILCEAGKFAGHGSAQCTVCPVGSVTQARGGSSCTTCQPGFHSNFEGTACTRCAVGRFAENIGSAHCTNCSFGTTTDGRGSDSRLNCLCPSGQYSGRSGSCEPCPEGMTCEIGSNISNYELFFNGGLEQCEHSKVVGCFPWLRPSFWSSELDPTKVYECRSVDACPGGLPGACPEHMFGMSCARCDDEYFRPSLTSKCEPCSKVGSVMAPLALFSFFLCCGVFIYVWNHRMTRPGFDKAVVPGIILGEALSFVQSLGILSRLNFNWPDQSADLVDTFQAFTFNMRVLRLDCWVGESLNSRYMVPLTFPVIIVAFFLFWFGVSKCLERWDRARFKAFNLDAVLCASGMLLQAFYIAIATSVVTILDCAPNPNPDRTLRFMPDIVCFDSEHAYYLAVGSVFFLLYCVGLFILFAWAIVMAPSRICNDSFRLRYKFLFFKFHPSKWWFGLVHTLRALILALVTIVSPDDNYIQFLIMLVILVAFAVWHLNDLPFFDRSANNVEMLQLSFLIVILVLGSWHVQNEEFETYGNADKTDILAMAIVCSVCTCLAIIALTVCWTAYYASRPAKAKELEMMAVEKLMPNLRASSLILAKLDDDCLRRLLFTMPYMDRWHVAELVNSVGLELCEAQSRRWSQWRLPVLARSVRFDRSQSQELNLSSIRLQSENSTETATLSDRARAASPQFHSESSHYFSESTPEPRSPRTSRTPKTPKENYDATARAEQRARTRMRGLSEVSEVDSKYEGSTPGASSRNEISLSEHSLLRIFLEEEVPSGSFDVYPSATGHFLGQQDPPPPSSATFLDTFASFEGMVSPRRCSAALVSL